MSHSVSHLPGADSELMRLVNAACEGTATLEDGRRLEALLATASNRGFYLAATEVHASLLWRWQPGDGLLRIACPGGPQTLPADGPPPASSAARAAIVAVLAVIRGWLRQLGRPAPLACLVSVALIGGLLLVASRTHLVQETDGFGTAGTRVAVGGRVIGLHDVAWAAGQPPRQEWEALRPGDVLAITRGLVQLRHDGGAVVVIEGPATYTLLGATSGRLDSGRVVARTEHDPQESVPGGPLFSIETRWRMVHDLGTEFGVEVGDRGETGVHVFAGLVELAAVDTSRPAPEPPLRLAAGASAAIDEAGRLVQKPGNLARGFVRAMPRQPGQQQTLLERIGWDETAAEIIYRDQFRAAGSVVGSTPESRGGVGCESWIAPPAGWTMDAGGLTMDREGSGFLPFAPRPGRLYRLSIKGEVLGGGLDWVGFGFTRAADPGQVMQKSGAFARMMQRQDTAAKPNVICFTPATNGPWQEVDRYPGPAFVRSIILDTRERRWTASFFLGDTLLCRHAYDGPLDAIGYVAISGSGQARARLHEVALAECRPGVPATPDPGGG